MGRILIIGADTVVGAGLAEGLSGDFSVTAATNNAELSFDGCEMIVAAGRNGVQVARRHFGQQPPERMIICSAAAVSFWENREFPAPERFQAEISAWSELASDWNCHVVFVSSDAVFRGPWMFHSESSDSFCGSSEATAIRAAEQIVLDSCPRSLIFRTNVLGWSPDGNGWLDTLVESLASRQPHALSASCHASPMSITAFRDIAAEAIRRGLTGLHHVAGAERISPARWAELMAQEFGLPAPLSVAGEQQEPSSASGQFASGECSLRTRKLREALDISVPMITETIHQLRDTQPASLRRVLKTSEDVAA